MPIIQDPTVRALLVAAAGVFLSSAMAVMVTLQYWNFTTTQDVAVRLHGLEVAVRSISGQVPAIVASRYTQDDAREDFAIRDEQIRQLYIRTEPTIAE